MLKSFKTMLLLSAIYMLIISSSFADRDWDYYGSGRDHPYSAYIDRANYIGPADYTRMGVDYIDGPLVISKLPAPVNTPFARPVLIQPAQFIVNIPNTQGGFNSVVIKKAGEGFIGPQGEYYPEFPKVFQLQMKYGK